jgi:transposase-like protein
MDTFFRGKVVRIMPKKYDEEFKARAVRLVTDHVEEYDSRTACVAAVAKRLGVAPESLRRWINQSEVDTGVRDGVPTDMVHELRQLKRKNRELEQTMKSSRRQQVSSRGRATRDTADLCVRRRASGSVRGRSDLPRAVRARRHDRPENLLCLAGQATVGARLVGYGDHRGAGRLLRTKRARTPQARVVVRGHQDVGSPATPGHHGGPLQPCPP